MVVSMCEAYIAITTNGHVEGACCTQAADSKQWVEEMEKAGLSVKRVNQKYAKEVLYTTIQQATLLA